MFICAGSQPIKDSKMRTWVSNVRIETALRLVDSVCNVDLCWLTNNQGQSKMRIWVSNVRIETALRLVDSVCNVDLCWLATNQGQSKMGIWVSGV